MRCVRGEIVHAPAARVWGLLVDVEGWPAWTESMREIKRREDGPLVVGSRSRVTQPKGGRGMDGPVGVAGDADGGGPDPLLPGDGEHGLEAVRRAGLVPVVTRRADTRAVWPRREIPGDRRRDL
jgi:hypothetical protein